jgi:hypothetical protein
VDKVNPWKVIEVSCFANDDHSRWNYFRPSCLVAVEMTVCGSIRNETIDIELKESGTQRRERPTSWTDHPPGESSDLNADRLRPL